MMKHKYAVIILFTSAIIGLLSFKPNEEDAAKNKGSFIATIDGRAFQLKADDMLKGILANKAGSIDGKTPSRTIINAAFNGPSYDKPDGKPFNEVVRFEINYAEQKLGEPDLYSVELQFQSTAYAMVKELSKIKITQFNWETDHKHFRLSADFDCKMRSWGYPMDGKRDVSLKGKMTDVRVTVPSWVTAKQ